MLVDSVEEYAIYMLDPDGNVLTWNAGAEKIKQYTAEEIIGKNFASFYTAEDVAADKPQRNLREASRKGHVRDQGLRIRKDGSTFPMKLEVGEMRSGEGRFFTGFIRDLTERQQTEDQLHDMQTELARLSRLTAMGEMASTLAHEINQPLSAISNYLQGCNRLLESVEHPNVPKIRDALAETTKQTLRAGHIIRQLREFVARGETEKRPENISKLVEEASALALVGAKEEG